MMLKIIKNAFSNIWSSKASLEREPLGLLCFIVGITGVVIGGVALAGYTDLINFKKELAFTPTILVSFIIGIILTSFGIMLLARHLKLAYGPWW